MLFNLGKHILWKVVFYSTTAWCVIYGIKIKAVFKNLIVCRSSVASDIMVLNANFTGVNSYCLLQVCPPMNKNQKGTSTFYSTINTSLIHLCTEAINCVASGR